MKWDQSHLLSPLTSNIFGFPSTVRSLVCARALEVLHAFPQVGGLADHWSISHSTMVLPSSTRAGNLICAVQSLKSQTAN